MFIFFNLFLSKMCCLTDTIALCIGQQYLDFKIFTGSKLENSLNERCQIYSALFLNHLARFIVEDILRWSFFRQILYNAEQHSFPRNRECRLLRVISGHNFCWHAWRQFPRGFLSSRQRSTQHETVLLLSFLKGANLNLHSVALLGNDRRTGEISWKPPEKLSHEKTRL